MPDLIAVNDLPSPSSLFFSYRIPVSDGATLTAYTAGDDHLQTVFLVNAYGMPVEFMVPLAMELRDRARVVTWDCRLLPSLDGVAADAECGVARHVDDLWDIAAALNVNSPIAIAGWCTGASIALEAASDAARVKALVLMNGAFYLGKRRKTGFERTMEMVMPLVAEDANYAAMLVESMRMLDSRAASDSPDQPRRPSSSVITALDPELAGLTGRPYACVDRLQRYARLLEAFLSYRPSARAMEAAGSAFIVTGALDGTIHPSSSLILHEQCPTSTLWTHETGDHYMLIRNHDVIQRVAAHLLAPSIAQS